MKTKLIPVLTLLFLGLLLGHDSQAQRYRGGGNRGGSYHPSYRGGYYGGYGGGYRSYGGYRGYSGYGGYAPYRGQRVLSFSGPRLILPYGGINFNYSSGYYYRPYGSYYRVVAPPLGIHISILPRGYRNIYVGSVPYYYYGGAYYRPGPNRDYEVVDAPLGASVPELPGGTEVVVINGQKYFELDGTYYKEDIRDNSEIWYTVVGKDGKLNTDEEGSYDEPQQQPPSPSQQAPPSGPAVGDTTDKLPADCRTVVVSGNKYFVSPDDVYYEEVVGQNSIRYKVVGK